MVVNISNTQPFVQDLLPGMAVTGRSGYTEDVRIPSFTAMDYARDESAAATELEYFNKPLGEFSPLKTGTRVYFNTVEGPFTGTVLKDWNPDKWPSVNLHVVLDCKPESPIEFHRSLFTAFTALDHLARVE